jgi:hypothetical protein
MPGRGQKLTEPIDIGSVDPALQLVRNLYRSADYNRSHPAQLEVIRQSVRVPELDLRVQCSIATRDAGDSGSAMLTQVLRVAVDGKISSDPAESSNGRKSVQYSE